MPEPVDMSNIAFDGDITERLLNNAAKYTSPGGSIELKAERDGDHAVIRVSDSGIGIAPEMLEHIFTMFGRADPASERTEGGLGIGLTLAQQLANMHGGDIQAVSRGPNQGSTFIVRLPLASARVAAPACRQAAKAASLRILVADDNTDAAVSLSMLLEAYGHDVQVAHDGARAVEIAARFEPQLALLDIGMPKLDGYQAAAQIRALPVGDTMRLVAVTGWGQHEDRRKSLAAGFDEHITKPVDIQTLQRLSDEAGASSLARSKGHRERA
jgi:CheY-like chemotaxis protein